MANIDKKSAKVKYDNEYKKEHYRRTTIELSIEDNDIMLSHLDKTGESKSGFIKRAIFETIINDNKKELQN